MSVATDHTGPWTVADVLRLPEDRTMRYELLGESLVMSPAPGIRHQRASYRLHAILDAAARAADAPVEILEAINVTLPSGLVVPDLVICDAGATAEDGVSVDAEAVQLGDPSFLAPRIRPGPAVRRGRVGGGPVCREGRGPRRDYHPHPRTLRCRHRPSRTRPAVTEPMHIVLNDSAMTSAGRGNMVASGLIHRAHAECSWFLYAPACALVEADRARPGTEHLTSLPGVAVLDLDLAAARRCHRNRRGRRRQLRGLAFKAA